MDGKIIIDTNENAKENLQTYKTELKDYTNGIIVFNDEMILTSQTLGGDTSYNYNTISSMYSLENFNKQDIENLFNDRLTLVKINANVLIVILIVMFISNIVSTFITIGMLMILGYLTSRMFGIKLNESEIYKISIYSLTLPIILNILYVILEIIFGVQILYFRTMYSIIAYIYLIASMLIIKSDNIKKQQVINKVIEVQKQAEWKIDEEQQQNNDNKNDRDEKNKEDENETENQEENLNGDIM